MVIPLVVLLLYNLLLVFTPEIGFDALWYHLTLPKLWLLKKQWFFPGGLMYYSAMPRLTETIFIPLIKYTGTIGPKFLQFLSGVGTTIIIWKILEEYKLSKVYKLAGIALFYCTFLVSWQSGSAYIDLFRTFLEILALFFLLKGNWKLGGISLGLAIGTKWLSLGSLAIYALIFGSEIVFPALLVAAPWFAVAYHFTGNPVYPVFSGINDNFFAGFSSILKHVLYAPFFLTKPFDDFLSPIIGLVFIICLISLTQKDKILRKISLVGILGVFFVMTLNPPSSRYLLPYLPAVIIPAIIFVNRLGRITQKIFFAVVIFSSFFVLGLRTVVMEKYIPYLTGKQSTTQYLVENADRMPDTFIDSDGFVSGLPKGSKILVDKLHNLYYFPSDFDHTSWVTNKSGYDYLITVGETGKGIDGELVHKNNLGIQVFKLTK